MERGRKPWLMNRGLVVSMMAITLLLVSNASHATVGEVALNLAQEVNQLMQACQTGEGLTKEQLNELIASCDTLKGAISQGNHPQKKLFLIRLNKTRNLCLYLLELKQTD